MLLQTFANVCSTLHGNVYFRLGIDVIANICKTFAACFMVTLILG